MEQSTMMQAVGGILARNIDPRDLMYLSMEELEEAGKSIAEDIPRGSAEAARVLGRRHRERSLSPDCEIVVLSACRPTL